MLITMNFKFTLLHKSNKSNARVGVLETLHGLVHTPAFVAVATNGTLKTIDNITACELGQELIFCNSYHLLLHPGPSVIEAAGGLHKYINYSKSIITDSGGFQVFSLAYGGIANELKHVKLKDQQNMILRISEDGVLFRSYRDNAKILLTPERSVSIQKQLGSDIIIPFDELPPYNIDIKQLQQSLERTHRWEKRSLDAHLDNPKEQAMFAVVHGGVNKEMRSISSKYLNSLSFDGFAIGGSLGTCTKDVVKVLQYSIPHLDPQKPRHLLGIGDIPTITSSISFGIDMFDSSYPSKIARHGLMLTLGSAKNINISRGIWAQDFRPIDLDCSCYTCRNYTRAYLHHLFKAHEPTGHSLATIHNLATMQRYMIILREKIIENKI